ncbi:MAG: peptidase T, partial [Promethearchaeota archaeon]
GKEILFPENKEIRLKLEDSEPLKDYIGMDIITASGDTLLGADDKAGIAEIMAACAAWKSFPELHHGPIVICFTPDEEIGRGTVKIDKKKLPSACYTIDGSEMGQLEIECFDAWKVMLYFKGLNVHPGYAKNQMINAVHIASRFLSELPEFESPEHAENREGFYHLMNLQGNEEQAKATLIIRDFKVKNNEERIEYLNKLIETFKIRYSGLKIKTEVQHQYQNMLAYLEKEQKIINVAKEAIEKAGLKLKIHSIRGGTDGAQLSAMGIPTPNIFTGGLLFHSRKEYIPSLALQKAAEVILYLADLWTK